MRGKSSVPSISRWMRKMHQSGVSQISVGNAKQYEDAINLLNSRRRDLRPKTIPKVNESLEAMPKNSTFTGSPSLSGMKTWLSSLGHSDTDIDNLNVIHVAGTKGKGSTCAFTASFLKAHGDRTGWPKRIGLYTSPHLKRVQERIQINGKSISEDLFAKYVFEVWDNLTSHTLPKPRYLQLLMLVSIHAFIREKVDAAVYETHSGGQYDATNIFLEPVITGISTIGMDHVEQLGPSIENIAWHKAGIFKSGRPAFSAPQEPLAATVLERQARERNVPLKFADVDPLLPINTSVLRPPVQRINASLALALTHCFLEEKAPPPGRDLTDQDISVGVQQFSWIGRFQHIAEGRHHWFLDGAHNELSVQNAAEWFAEMLVQSSSGIELVPRIVIFSQISERDGAAILRRIATTLQERHVSIQYLIITTYKQRMDGADDVDRCFQNTDQPFPTDLQEQYSDAWKSIFPKTQTAFEPTVEGALKLARSFDEGFGTQTLVTGSLYLVGATLRLLESHV